MKNLGQSLSRKFRLANENVKAKMLTKIFIKIFFKIREIRLNISRNLQNSFDIFAKFVRYFRKIRLKFSQTVH